MTICQGLGRAIGPNLGIRPGAPQEVELVALMHQDHPILVRQCELDLVLLQQAPGAVTFRTPLPRGKGAPGAAPEPVIAHGERAGSRSRTWELWKLFR